MAGRPGKSGRKPKGEFSKLNSSLTIRIPDDMRKQLESEAAAGGQSVAQVLLWHLRRSFSRENELERDSAIRAFCFLISELADKIIHVEPSEWQRNPFLFRAFKIGVAKLLDAFEPEGEMRPPQQFSYMKEKAENRKTSFLDRQLGRYFVKIWKSPTSAANEAVQHTLSDLYSTAPPRELWDWSGLDHKNKAIRRATKFSLMQQERTWYGMPNVRRDLGLPEKSGPGGAILSR